MNKPTAKIEVPIPDVEGLDDLINPGEETLDALIEKAEAARKQIKKLKTDAAHYDLQIGAILDLNQLKRVVWRGLRVVSRKEAASPRKTIDPAKLIALGVAPSIIHAATVYGKPGRLGIVIRSLGSDEEEDEE